MKISDLFLILAAFVIGTVAAASCAGRPQQPDPYTIGGPGWRVFDANRLTGPEAWNEIREQHGVVERCLGQTRGLGSTAVYTTTRIEYRTPAGWRRAGGMWLGRYENGNVQNLPRDGRERLYVVTAGKSLDWIRHVLRHELVHYVAQLGHPHADSLIARCA